MDGREPQFVVGRGQLQPRLLDRVRQTIRARHYSRRTERAYVFWIKQYIFFPGKRHPAELEAEEITAFLNHLAVRRNVSASTQNQARNAVLFLYKNVPTGSSPGWIASSRPSAPSDSPWF